MMSTCNWSKRTSGVANVEIGLKVCLCTLNVETGDMNVCICFYVWPDIA